MNGLLAHCVIDSADACYLFVHTQHADLQDGMLVITAHTPWILLRCYIQTTVSFAHASSTQLLYLDWSSVLQAKTSMKHQATLSGQQRWAVPGQKMKVGGVLAGVHLMQIPRVR